MTYEIHRYPADLIDVVRLAGGERVVIRPVLPAGRRPDGCVLRNLVGASALRPVHDQHARAAARSVAAIHAGRLCEPLGARGRGVRGGRETVVAEARYVRRADPTVAEFAVSVAEPWQGKKLASLMLGKLSCRAAAEGVKHIVGETLATNARTLTLARKAGFTIVPSSQVRGLMLLERALEAPSPGGRCSGAEVGALAA